jgi:glycosyltransferase involved in cell wall biosynthesis
MTTNSNNRPRLLLLAHSCNPEIGSEPGMGWNRALQAAKEFSTWIICDSETSRGGVDRYLLQHGPIENLKFVFVPPNWFEQKLSKLPGTFWVRYNLWHRRAYRIASDLDREIKFDLVHQFNLCGFREPGYCWKLDAPFVWGPVGGAQNYPWRFLTSAGFAGMASEVLRNVLNTWQMRFARRVGLAGRKAAVMLTANTTNARALAPRCRSKLQTMLEIGAPIRQDLPPRDFHHAGPLRILWSGVFEHRKALHLLLDAVSQLPPDVEYELRILGRGPLEKRWRKTAEWLGVSTHCRWMGWLDQPLAIAQYDWADVFAFTSLRDTTGTVVLESLAAGTPIVCLNHQGVADVVTDDCGVKLPVTNPRDVVKSLRETLVRLHRDRKELSRLGAGAVRRAEYYAWDRQGQRMAAIYRDVLQLNSLIGNHPPQFTETIETSENEDQSNDNKHRRLAVAHDGSGEILTEQRI